MAQKKYKGSEGYKRPNLFKSIFNTFAFFSQIGAHSLKTLQDEYFKDAEVNKSKDGSVILKARTGGDHIIMVKISPAQDGTVNIHIKGDNGKSKIFENVPESRIDDKIGNWIDSTYGEAIEDIEYDDENKSNKKKNVKESRRCDVRLRKITSSRYCSVVCKDFTANYDDIEAYDDICEVCQDDNFVDNLPENEDVLYQLYPKAKNILIRKK